MVLRSDRNWRGSHWVNWEKNACSKTPKQATAWVLSRLMMCFFVSDVVMMRFMTDVVKMPYITLPSNVTSSACWLLSAFCLLVSYCLSTYRVIFLVRILFLILKRIGFNAIVKAFRTFCLFAPFCPGFVPFWVANHFVESLCWLGWKNCFMFLAVLILIDWYSTNTVCSLVCHLSYGILMNTTLADLV